MHTSNLPYSQDVWLSYASVKHWVDCATPSSGIADAAMLAASSLPPTTTIPAISAHRGAHTMKMITNHLGFIRRRAQTHQGLGGALQTSSPFELCELTGPRHTSQRGSCRAPGGGFTRPAVKAQQRPPHHVISPSQLFEKNEQYVHLMFQLRN